MSLPKTVVLLIGLVLSCAHALARAPLANLSVIAASGAAAAAKVHDTSYARTLRELNLTSKQGRHYRVLVSVPHAAPPKSGYPVLYVLDGNGWFGPAVEIARMREYEKLAPTIVVGIAPAGKSFFDVSRSYDFTPPGTLDADFEGVRLGGADEFRGFLDDVVQPWVHAHFETDAQQRILFGHSLGGTFVLHTLFTSPQSFDVYLAASPHIRFSDEFVVKEAAAFATNPRRGAVRVLLTVGSLEAHPSPALVEDYRRWYTNHPEEIPGVTVAQAIDSLFQDNGDYDKPAQTRALVERLAQSGVAAQFVLFDGDEHMAAAISGLNRGIPFALRPPAK